MGNKYMTRHGPRQESFMEMINEYPKVHGVHSFLVVEGKSDEKFFKKFLNFDVCGVSNIGSDDKDRDSNKKKVLDFIEKQNRKHKEYYLGIVDADFEHILHKDKVPPNVIVTDCHDMEMLTLKSQPDMNSIYAELANPMLIKKYEEENSKIFIESIIDIAFEIGICKLVCINRNQYSRLNTQNLDYRDFVDRMLNIDIDKLILQVVRGNPGKGVSEFDISNQISSEKEKKHDRYQICCGHDVTNILELCFSQYGLGFGNENCLNTSRIESLLRTAYTSESFKKTDMYKKILEWEEKNNIKILDRMKIPD